MRPWNNIPIKFLEEELLELPESFYRLEPHPYMALGAPYGENSSPWQLRVQVIKRLTLAQSYLKKDNPKYMLAIFDAWRPIEVQKYMIDYVIKKEYFSRYPNQSLQLNNCEYKQIVKEVSAFWAPPNLDPLQPPPHSTGGAIDLTLATLNRCSLDMGGEIDEIGLISNPDYYSNPERFDNVAEATLWNSRRTLLRKVMTKAGFVQHPNEWWHFSFGDQLWAWINQSPSAYYGAYSY